MDMDRQPKRGDDYILHLLSRNSLVHGYAWWRRTGLVRRQDELAPKCMERWHNFICLRVSFAATRTIHYGIHFIILQQKWKTKSTCSGMEIAPEQVLSFQLTSTPRVYSAIAVLCLLALASPDMSTDAHDDSLRPGRSSHVRYNRLLNNPRTHRYSTLQDAIDSNHL